MRMCLSAGTHGTTYGGSPLGCAVALKVMEVVQRENLADNARNTGGWLKAELAKLAQKFPGVIEDVRGLGFMLGMVLRPSIPNLPGENTKPVAVRFVQLLHTLGLLTIPAGTQVVRLLPPLNLRRNEAEEALRIIEDACAKTA